MDEYNVDFPYATFNAVIDPSEPATAPRLVRLHHSSGSYEAWSWLPPSTHAISCIHKARIALVPSGACDVLAQSIEDSSLDVFDLIPDDFGRSEGIVVRCRNAVDGIQSDALRRFLSDVFSMPVVYYAFWTCPASQAHHHAYAGGLADHSVEMAEDVLCSARLDPKERDIGIAYALLHDIGKLWCYDEDGIQMQPLGHELVGLSRLSGPLDALERAWPDGATAMRSLLSGMWKRRGEKPILAVGKLVQAFDQASTERNLRKGCERRFEPWTPRAEAGVSGSAPSHVG